MATSGDFDLNKITMVCETCGVNMVGIIPYRAHMQGKQHKRAEELAKNKSLILTTTTTTFEFRGDNYFCKVCNKSMTGPEPYRQHMESAKHLKAVALVALKSPATTTFQIKETQIIRMDCSDTVDDKADDYYYNKHMKHVTIVEPSESIADALSKMGYI